MTTYNLMFKKIKPEAIIAVREAIKYGLFKQDNSQERKLEILQMLNHNLCTIYNLPLIEIIIDETCEGIGRFEYDKIRINKCSLVTFLHEFAHYKFIFEENNNSEEKARGWSLSLYYLAAPKLFKNAVKKDLIIHLDTDGNNREDEE